MRQKKSTINKLLVRNNQFLLIGVFLFSSLLYCNSDKPKIIKSGEQTCSYCRMKIVDRRFNAQAVTTRGKHYHYDSIECMVADTQDKAKTSSEVFLKKYVKDFFNPDNFVEAEKAHYIFSEKLASPMGAGISAYAEQESVQKAQKKYDGQTLTFPEVEKRVIETWLVTDY